MKHAPAIHFLMVIAFALSGCGPASPTERSTRTDQSPHPEAASTASPSIPPVTPTPLDTIPSPTVVLSTATPMPSITPTAANTLEPGQANETIKALLHEPIDCSAPCFWGITPIQTTKDEAGKIFSHLGLQMMSATIGGKDYSSAGYTIGNGFTIRVILTTAHDIVENLQIKINTGEQTAGNERAWLAYSPETLIERYGMPSRVVIFADWGEGSFFSMQMYFDANDLIVQYTGQDIIPSKIGPLTVCPLTMPFETAWIWLGEDPKDPPGGGIPLEEATSLTMEDFSALMTGDPDQACFTFDGDVFP